MQSQCLRVTPDSMGPQPSVWWWAGATIGQTQQGGQPERRADTEGGKPGQAENHWHLWIGHTF